MGWQTPTRSSPREARPVDLARAGAPKNGDECVADRADSTAVVKSVSLARGYTRSSTCGARSERSAICDQRNKVRRAGRSSSESGGPRGLERRSDLAAEYRARTEGGDATAEVPDFIGIGLMSDGDQTNSDSSADFGAFTLTR